MPAGYGQFGTPTPSYKSTRPVPEPPTQSPPKWQSGGGLEADKFSGYPEDIREPPTSPGSVEPNPSLGRPYGGDVTSNPSLGSPAPWLTGSAPSPVGTPATSGAAVRPSWRSGGGLSSQPDWRRVLTGYELGTPMSGVGDALASGLTSPAPVGGDPGGLYSSGTANATTGPVDASGSSSTLIDALRRILAGG